MLYSYSYQRVKGKTLLDMSLGSGIVNENYKYIFMLKKSNSIELKSQSFASMGY